MSAKPKAGIPAKGNAAAASGMMGSLRAARIVASMTVLTAPLMPFQFAFRKVWNRPAELLPHYYHRGVCWLLGVRITIKGDPIRTGGSLIAANHSSWLDIPVLSACAPVSFVAKSEVNEWGIFGVLARLQRTMFVDRTRRSATATFRDAMQTRLARGDHLVLFPEGTSNDGNRVLPFKSALMGAADCDVRVAGNEESKVRVQPVSIAYCALHAIPMGRAHRHFFAWYGDMELLPHLWSALCKGPLDIEVRFHEPVTIAQFANRKELTRHCERKVADGVVSALLGRTVSSE